MRPWRVTTLSSAVLAFLALSSLLGRGAEAIDPEQLWRDGQNALTRGNHGVAIQCWERAATQWAELKQPKRQIETLLALGSVCQLAGQRHRALEVLEVLESMAREPQERAAVKELAGTFALLQGDAQIARRRFNEALELVEGEEVPRLRASLWNNLGNVELGTSHDYEALRSYARAEQLARKSGDGDLLARVLVNACRAAMRTGNRPLAERTVVVAETELRSWDDSSAKAHLYLSLAGAFGDEGFDVRRDFGPLSEQEHSLEPLGLRARLRPTSARLATGPLYDSESANVQRLIEAGYATAQAIKDERNQSLALGMLGQRYASAKRTQRAAELFDQAVIHAQRARASDLHYRWLWGLARCRRDSGQTAAAVAGYRQAIESLRTVRYDLVSGSANLSPTASFREAIGDLYAETADLLLREAAHEPSRERATQLLREVRQTQEQLRSAELEDYYRDECVSIALAQSKRVDEIAERTAVIYVIELPDRSELLVSLSGQRMERFTVPVRGVELEMALQQFRQLLEKRTTFEYLRLAQRLHGWLVAPMLGLLAENAVDTLVIIPQGALRLVPLAALFDGERYLIERFAVAMAPGLSLLGSQPLASRRRPRLLAAGLSLPMEGFANLSFVAQEVNHLASKADSTVVLDEQFTADALEKLFQRDSFSVVHLASHGQFEAEAESTFLVTFKGRLTLDNLEQLIKPSQYRGQPVELLGLSACQTASGDARAGLGLAGVALKAGARSALATLWFINDEASAILVGKFYDELLRPNASSKAKALQQAQCLLLSDPRYSHPAYWSPYLIIGNWL